MLRLRVGFLLIAMVLSVFAARLLQLQGLDSESYAEMAAAEGAVTVVLPAERGDILDRNGQALAQSVDGLMLVADPQMTRDQAPEIARFLSRQLDLDYFQTLTRLRKPDSRFQYLARQVPAAAVTEALEKADTLGFKGLASRNDPARDYPGGDVAANLVGFLGTPDPRKGTHPLAGFERTFNALLAGQDGSAKYQVSRGNRIPLAESTVVAPVDGRDLHTTIDRDLQWFAQRVLRQTVEDARGDSGLVVVQDTRTGEVLALADHPTFDATRPLQSPKGDLGSRAMSDIYEPGSVEKVLTMASLIDAGLVTPHTKILVPPELHRQDRVIHDWFTHGYLRLTLAGVVAKSSNIGTVLAADKMAARTLGDYLSSFGLGKVTDVGVAGEAAGLLPSGTALTPQTKDRIAFGQSLSVNALQMAAAVNTIANGGVYVAPSLIQGSARARGGQVVGTDETTTHRVVSRRAAHQTMLMMERVVDPEAGVAPGAAVPGYRVAGKTGTAQRVGEDGRYDGTFTVSFAGFAPADDPRLTVYVVVQNPRNGGGGGSVSGPAFSRIMGYALRHYGIPPTGTQPSRLPVEWRPR
ncbi:MAG TPA: penicillin-binding protein 2 [Nocardioides sp.]|uniref:peptidoglycan D,D-transpeptidase FtsI family protein n=1 Tax=Nocardioides sp. TaxID=35761 RepID=UPI002C30FA4D|nr:penicillin-binding protein 2 [Nocardioides sp.]HQR25787.1 penicillin-binding protein 2 [Nocardioides sp.]